MYLHCIGCSFKHKWCVCALQHIKSLHWVTRPNILHTLQFVCCCCTPNGSHCGLHILTIKARKCAIFLTPPPPFFKSHGHLVIYFKVAYNVQVSKVIIIQAAFFHHYFFLQLVLCYCCHWCNCFSFLLCVTSLWQPLVGFIRPV